MVATLAVFPVHGRGRGVVAGAVFRRGDLVEVSHVLELPNREVGDVLDRYVYTFGRASALALGYGSLFNHSASPTLSVRKRVRARVIEFRARRDVAFGEELTIDYGYVPAGYDGR